MQIKFKVKAAGQDPTEVQTSYADLIALEEKYGIDASDLGSRQRALWLAFLAYSALKRRGDVTATFEDWSATVETLEPVGDQGNA